MGNPAQTQRPSVRLTEDSVRVGPRGLRSVTRLLAAALALVMLSAAGAVHAQALPGVRAAGPADIDPSALEDQEQSTPGNSRLASMSQPSDPAVTGAAELDASGSAGTDRGRLDLSGAWSHLPQTEAGASAGGSGAIATARPAPSVSSGVRLGLLATALTLHVIDWRQTQYLTTAESRARGFHETNQFLDKYPTRGRVDAYFLGIAVLVCIATWLAPEYSPWFLVPFIADRTIVVRNNERMGLQTGF